MNREILKHFIVAYKNYTGYDPESVHVDKIYRTRENRAWCKERGIKISGPPLGRPPAHVSKEKKKQALESERIRNSIEGKFGQAKGLRKNKLVNRVLRLRVGDEDLGLTVDQFIQAWMLKDDLA